MNATTPSPDQPATMHPSQYLSIFINSVAMLLGIPGNALVVVVYANKRFRSSSHVLIMGLAVADFVVCVTRPVDVFLVTPKGLHFYHNFKFWCKGLPVVVTVPSHWSVYIMTLIAVERYLTVCRPHDRVLTPKRALLSVVISFIVAVIVDFPISITADNADFYMSGVFISRICDPTVGSRWLYVLHMTLRNSLTFMSLLVMIVLYAKVVIEVRRRTTTVRPSAARDNNASTSVFTDAGSTLIMSNFTKNHSNILLTAATVAKVTRFSIYQDENREVKSGNNDIKAEASLTIITSGERNDPEVATAHASNCDVHEDHCGHKGGKPKHDDRVVSFREATGGINSSLGAATVPAASAGTPAVVSPNHDEARKSTPRTGGGGRGKTTMMLLLTTAIFVVTYLPTVAMHLIPDRLLFVNYYTQKRILVTAFFIIRNLYISNHVINPILYGFINKRFRDDCRKVMRRIKC